MLKFKFIYVTLAVTLACSNQSANAESTNDGQIYLDLRLGGVALGDKNISQTEPDGSILTGNAEFSVGYTGGLGLGYYLTDNIAAEVAWDYRRSNIKNFALSDGSLVAGGDYASNAVTASLYYHFDSLGNSGIRPFVSAGAGFIEEIDFDQDLGNANREFQASGDFVYQLSAGASYAIGDQWDIKGEVRYLDIGNTSLESPDGLSSINGIQYDPLTFTLGIRFKFGG